MKVVILTIVLDGMPFIKKHLDTFERLPIQWEWRVAEGASANTHCTAWCKPQAPRLSRDSTTEYLNSLVDHPRVKLFRRQLWDGKVSMFNACLTGLDEECIILECDVDEFFSTAQIMAIVKMFQDRRDAMRAFFWCKYWLGRNIVATSNNGYGNRNPGEWLRAFRFRPGMAFSRHETPVLDGNRGVAITRDETKVLGLVFNHYAWLLESQAAAKQNFYGYPDALSHWKRLQENKVWPVKDLRTFLPWVGEGASADWVEDGVTVDKLK